MSIFANKLDFIQPSIFARDSGIEALFTLKNGEVINPDGAITGLNLGYSTGSESGEVEENRSLLFRQLNIDPDRVAFGEQVHGTRIRSVVAGGTYPETDGLTTQIPGLALAIQVADCAAVLLGDSAGGRVAAVHAGWRGAAGGILPKVLEMMRLQGSDPTDIKAFVSPCISMKNFEVGEEVAEQFPDEFVDRKRFKKPHVDLKAYLKHQMLEGGMKPGHIEVDERCTIADPGRFYSYRREGDKSGRMLGLIRLV